MALPVKRAFIAARKKINRLLLPLMQLAYALNEAGLTDEEIEGIPDDPELLKTVAETIRDVVHGVPSPRVHFERTAERAGHE